MDFTSPTLWIKRFTFNPLQENTYLLIDPATKWAVCIDPGCYSKAEQQVFTQFVADENLLVKAVWLTHSHVDHVLGVDFVVRKYGVKCFIHPLDVITLRSVTTYAPAYGLSAYQPVEDESLQLFEGDDMELVPGLSFKVLKVPGHAPGHIAFYQQESAILISGDTLFRQSIGRTDLPGGNYEQLMESIKNKILTLPDKTIVFPGHMDKTTVGSERKFNPFLQ